MASSVMLGGAYDMLEKMFYYIQDIGIYSQEECELRTHLIYTVLENLGENGIIMGQYIDLLSLYSIEFGYSFKRIIKLQDWKNN